MQIRHRQSGQLEWRDPIRHFIERYLTWVTTGFLAAVIGGFLILRFI